MRKIILCLLILLLLSSCALEPAPVRELITEDSYVIFADDWTPSKEEANEALGAIEKFFKEASKDNIKDNIFRKIYINIKKYKIQITGVVFKGEKLVYCNFILFIKNDSWKSRIIIGDTWQAAYNTKTKELSNINFLDLLEF